MPEQTPDYDAAWTEWNDNPSKESNAKILNTLDPIISKAVTANAGQLNPVLKGKGRLLTMQALKSYNPKQGKLVSHIYNHMQRLRRYSAQMSTGVHVPERIMLDRRAIDLANKELNDNLGREPTEDELADRVGLSTKRIKQVRRANPGMAEGYFSSMGEEGEGIDPAIRSKGSAAWEQLVKGDLDPIDQKIYEYTKQGLQNQEIAAKLRLTPGRVSQRKSVIQEQLNQEPQLSPF